MFPIDFENSDQGHAKAMITRSSTSDPSGQPASNPVPMLAQNKSRNRQILSHLRDTIESGGSIDAGLGDVSRAVGDLCQAAYVAFFHSDSTSSEGGRIEDLSCPSEGLKPELRAFLLDCCRVAYESGESVVEPLPNSGQLAAVAVPVSNPDAQIDVVIALIPASTHSTDRGILLFELLAVLSRECAKGDARATVENEARDAAALLELLTKIESCSNVDLACQTLVDELRQYLPCQTVVLGLLRSSRGPCHLRAASGSTVLDPKSELTQMYESALDESVLRASCSNWPPRADSQRHGLLAHKRLAEATDSEIVSCPIRDEQDSILGAWIFLSHSDGKGLAEKHNFIQGASRSFGACLRLLQRAERGRMHKFFSKLVSVPRRQMRVTAIVLAAILFGLLFMPLPHKVKCDCELQPVTRRFVAAPFDATLESSFVKPGDVVVKDELLAQIDGQEIHLELAGISADSNRASKERDGHLAIHDFGAAQIAKFEIDRLKIRGRVLERRGEHLEIRSPIDGIVISGDLKKAEGVPLTVGQTMFEIAPLERMIVELGIPEEDISYVSTGLPVDIAFDAFPGKRWHGELTHIHPRSEMKEHEHIFVGEFELDNQTGLLRPGVQGQAKITSDNRALGWILFHKAWERLVFWLGW